MPDSLSDRMERLLDLGSQILANEKPLNDLEIQEFVMLAVGIFDINTSHSVNKLHMIKLNESVFEYISGYGEGLPDNVLSNEEMILKSLLAVVFNNQSLRTVSERVYDEVMANNIPTNFISDIARRFHQELVHKWQTEMQYNQSALNKALQDFDYWPGKDNVKSDDSTTIKIGTKRKTDKENLKQFPGLDKQTENADLKKEVLLASGKRKLIDDLKNHIIQVKSQPQSSNIFFNMSNHITAVNKLISSLEGKSIIFDDTDLKLLKSRDLQKIFSRNGNIKLLPVELRALQENLDHEGSKYNRKNS